MKKLIVASAVAMSMAGGSAMASQGDVQFFGTVTAQTCDVVVDNKGTVSNMIQLGTVTNTGSQEGQGEQFTLKPAVAGSCDVIKSADVVWESPKLNDKGIANQSGGATDAYVKLVAKSGTANTTVNADQPIVSGANAINYTITDMDEGLTFEAKLVGGTVAGDFNTAAAYSVTYN
ncbi:hypothetical protein P4K01_001672 [Escherichia coli]|nr:hypothetical protein [Escherichia coli]